MRRQNLINMALDNVIAQMNNAVGTQGTISNRLNQSIAQDGSLKKQAMDDAEHSIDAHADSETYVRMQRAESAKLQLVSDGATNLYIQVVTGQQGELTFSDGALRFVPSNTVTFSVDEPNELKFNMVFPEDAAHSHRYGVTAVPADLVHPDWTNYKVSTTPYTGGSLRVYVNGVRLSPDAEIYVPGYMTTDPWTLLSYEEHPDDGTFTLSTPLSEDDVVIADYDIGYAES
jgi:hypothetical protein